MRPSRLRRLAVVGSVALLAACGGGSGGDSRSSAPASCSVADQKTWLAGYMDDWYFWYRVSPRPDAAGFGTVAAYFDAWLAGASAAFPADRWSNVQSTASFDRFFGDGATLGYGVSVAGLETDGDASRPLWVRQIDPGSPAATAGVTRGDQIVSLNGRPATEAITARDFSALGANAAGDRLTLGLRNNGADRTLTLTAAVYNLTPVPAATVITSTGGRKLGVLQVNQMISQASAPLDTAFAQFRSQGVQDLVLDLRYNGGGLVSLGATLASYIGGSRSAGQRYASLIYNDRHPGSNAGYDFSLPGNALALPLPRVFVLQGPRTCSASEQVINGLIGAGIQVVAIGSTTCGKPVGFNPTSNCGSTYSVVNFESQNRLGTGRYFDGLTATCAAAEDFSVAQNGSSDPLLAGAVQYADSGQCPRSAPVPRAARRPLRPEPAGFEGMLAR